MDLGQNISEGGGTGPWSLSFRSVRMGLFDKFNLCWGGVHCGMQ